LTRAKRSADVAHRVKLFCSRCGLEKNIEETGRTAVVTCVGCGNRFPAGPPAAPPKGGSQAAIIAVVAVVAVPVVVAVIGILAAIAIPNFIRFQARSKQTECKVNLKAFVAAERSYFDANQRYTTRLGELGFEPERGNRYAFFAGAGTRERRDEATASRQDSDTQVGVDRFRYANSADLGFDSVPKGLHVGVEGTCPDCSIVAACVGNIDNDDTLDVWSVSTRDREMSSGERVPAGVPHNDVNDVSE
jgi:type IV pilus assembly protein PilA